MIIYSNLKSTNLLCIFNILDDNFIDILKIVKDKNFFYDKSLIFSIRNTCNLKKYVFFIKRNFKNYKIIKNDSFDKNYEFINNYIDIDYSYLLNINLYSKLFIDDIDISYYYFIFNDLNILLDSNNKEIINNQSLSYSKNFICKRQIFESNLNEINKHFYKKIFLNLNKNCLLEKTNNFSNYKIIFSCILKNKKDILYVLNLIKNNITQNLILIYNNLTKFNFDNMIKDIIFFKKVKSKFKNHLFNYILANENLENNFNYIYINNSYFFNMSLILKILSFSICNKNFVNLYKNKNENIFAWVLKSNYNSIFFKEIKNFVINFYINSINNIFFYLLTKNINFYRNLYQLKVNFFKNILFFTDKNIIFSKFLLKNNNDLYKIKNDDDIYKSLIVM